MCKDVSSFFEIYVINEVVKDEYCNYVMLVKVYFFDIIYSMKYYIME